MSSKNHNLKHKAPNRGRVKPTKDDPRLTFEELGGSRQLARYNVSEVFLNNYWSDEGTGAALAVVDVVWRALAPVPVSVLANQVPGAFLVRNRTTRRAVADALATLAWDDDD